jgi:hypothetical protein
MNKTVLILKEFMPALQHTTYLKNLVDAGHNILYVNDVWEAISDSNLNVVAVIDNLTDAHLLHTVKQPKSNIGSRVRNKVGPIFARG